MKKVRNPYDGMSQEDLDEAVYDAKSGEASVINNQGREVQIGYLTREPFGNDPVSLSREDWVEIYYALESKMIDIAEYNQVKVEQTRWAKHLNRIIEKIGPDGDEAAERGVDYNA